MVRIAVIAHHVSTPLYTHRSKEFFERMYFMAKRYDEVHIISEERSIDGKNRAPLEDELASNLMVHRIRTGLVSSNLDILQRVKEVEADVIFADGIVCGASSLLCKKGCAIPLVTFVQGYEADLKAIGLKLKLGMRPTPGLLARAFALYDSAVLRASDKVLCVSSGLAEYARGLLAKKDWCKIEVIPHSLQYVKHISEEATVWADKIISSLETRHGERFLLFMVVGIGPAKGTDIALNALKYMVKKNPRAVMVLVGKAIDPKYVRMAKKLRLQNNVLFLENLSRDRVLALLSCSSVFLFPSLSEGNSFSVAEAMVLGVPIVAYTNKSLRDALNKGAGLGIKTTDPEDFSRECLSLVGNEKLREALVRKAQDYVRSSMLFPEKERFELICDSIDQVLSTKKLKQVVK